MEVDGSGAYTCDDLVSRLRARGSSTMDKLLSICTTSSNTELNWFGPTARPTAWPDAVAFRNNFGTDVEPSPVMLSQVMGAQSQDSESKSTVGIILCNTPLVSPSMRDAHLTAMFLGSIPTYVMSMAVPYLDVEFVFDRQPAADDKSSFNRYPRAPTALRFLMGKNVLAPGVSSADSVIAASMCDRSKDGTIWQEHTYMDMFCSPQTMTSHGTMERSAHYNEVLDPSRPFASIESLNINVSPTVGFHTFKKGTLIIKLHDRSRLVDIADLIKPAEFNRVTCYIQYGWLLPKNVFTSHEGVGYSDLFDRMMTPPEAYGVSNVTMSTDPSGQCGITLELFTKSQMFARSQTIVVDGIAGYRKYIDEATAMVREYRKQLGLGEPDNLKKEVRLHQLLNAASNGSVPDLKGNDKSGAFKDLENALAGIKQSATKDKKDIIEKFINSVKDVSTESFQDRIKGTVSKKIASEISKLVGDDPWLPKKKDDPFFDAVKWYNETLGPKGQNVATLFKIDPKIELGPSTPGTVAGVCSLAKLLSVFLAKPFREMGNEVQLIFYTFNDHAGYMAAAQNIGNFPIEVNVFADRFYRTMVEMGTGSMTIEEFMGFVFNTLVNDNFALGYGLRRFYEPYDGSSKGSLKQPPPDAGTAADKMKTFESYMAQYADHHGPWKTPQVDVYMETVAARASGNDVSANSSFNPSGQRAVRQKITRIHIFDKQANVYREVQSAISAGDDEDFLVVVDPLKNSLSRLVGKEHSAAVREALKDTGVVETRMLSSDSNMVGIVPSSKMSYQKFKDVVSVLVPTLVYGSNSSNILNASLSTKGDPLLSTRNMVQQSKKPQNTSHPNGAGVGNMPVQVIPATLSMTSMGCPTFHPAQVYFIDFNTGTSMDNLYILTTLSHVITPGKFESSTQYGFQDGYAKFKSPASAMEALEAVMDYQMGPKEPDPSPGKTSKK